MGKDLVKVPLPLLFATGLEKKSEMRFKHDLASFFCQLKEENKNTLTSMLNCSRKFSSKAMILHEKWEYELIKDIYTAASSCHWLIDIQGSSCTWPSRSDPNSRPCFCRRFSSMKKKKEALKNTEITPAAASPSCKTISLVIFWHHLWLQSQLIFQSAFKLKPISSKLKSIIWEEQASWNTGFPTAVIQGASQYISEQSLSVFWQLQQLTKPQASIEQSLWATAGLLMKNNGFYRQLLAWIDFMQLLKSVFSSEAFMWEN